ncbi:uncharacterized protein LOC126376792 [Pectinophora gossypiella]|uniref:uncharacterized protein LOC126376792 n=1 Tax=Pectinophora gossypiella TaxID=13191 RepID=UPI00214E2240|nr:uncharacterized protein LOC126376792 [Pectinophora gossypiella]
MAADTILRSRRPQSYGSRTPNPSSAEVCSGVIGRTRPIKSNVPFNGTRAICHACWHRIDSDVNQNQPGPQPAALAALVNPPGIMRAANTSRRCMFNDCNRTQLRPVPNSIKVHLLSYFNFYIPNRARICDHHLLHTIIEDIPGNVRNLSGLNGEHVKDIIDMYRTALEQRHFLDFENIEEMSEYDLRFWTMYRTALEQRHFLDIENIEEMSEYDLRFWTGRELFDPPSYLSKLRTAEPNNRLATAFNVSVRTVDRKIHSVRSCLLEDFLPQYLGFNHITREQVIEHNRILPNYFFGNEVSPKAIVILDGTYLFIEKSTNFLFQRVTYSTNKYRNLMKPFMIVCADGYILDVTGPYAARTSDADIMKQILQNHNEPMGDGVCIKMHFDV